ncbi:ArsR/SmtB family transcription factor [Bacillus sp. B1-b2]|uniref:ArsR/SmtB family transcription factor n=1 Tax=Bacillus sp. B1-b2 TaxID=2653201 RepID=UPI0012620C8C|nr:metalloregulator ArsR/SmtB family transcription factor [Bacillus sp. B1-b2]KAB7673075.1 winged helix-turn-helix transcriptional regulator [Bacillus sp. B1-b2]
MTEQAKKHDVFQAVADPTRRQVLKLLSEKDLSIVEIADQFTISRNAIVKHLQILSDAKLIEGKKVGRSKLYHIRPEPLQELHEWISYYEHFWSNKLALLKYKVENNNEQEKDR